MTAALATTDLTADQARSLERAFLSGLNEAQDAFERIVACQAWTLLGHDSLASWWDGNVQPVMRALSMRPTPALAAAVVERVRAEEASLPPAQRRRQHELAGMVGATPDEIRNRAPRSTSAGNPTKDDLGTTQFPGPVDAATSPPADPGTAPEPGAVPSAAQPGPVELAPAADAPASSQEPDPAASDLKARIRQDLAEVGAEGTTQAAIGLGFPRGVLAGGLEAAIRELVAAGEVLMVGRSPHGGAPLWALAESLTEPPTCLGADMDCGRPLPCPDHPRTAEERIAAVAEVAPEFVKPVEPKPSLRLVPTDDEKRAAVQRDARGLLRRAVEILAPEHDRPGFAATWAQHLGPYDAELSELIRRASEAIATLDDLIEGCGQ